MTEMNVYQILDLISNRRNIVRDRVDWLRHLRDNWNDDQVVTDAMVNEFKQLFGIEECRVAVDGSTFAKNLMNSHHLVFIIAPKTPGGLEVEMDIDNVENDAWVSVPWG